MDAASLASLGDFTPDSHLLLRKVAAAFRRRDFAACDRLSEEADAIAP
jgi:hypothetical protein